MRARLALLIALFLVGLGVAGCAGDDEESAPPPPTTTAPKPPAAPAEALIQFLTAVENENDTRAWQLVSHRTINAFNYNPRHFESNIAPALREELRLDPRTIFSDQFAGGHALIVLADANEAAGGGPFAATLLREDGGWRVQLFYPQFVATLPQETERLRTGRHNFLFDVVRRRDQKLRVRLWLDGEPLRLRLRSTGNFVVSYSAPARVTRGEHTLIAHAITAEGLSGAYAWKFTGR